MANSGKTTVTSISGAKTLDEIAAFWDTHSLADYWDQTREVEFEISLALARRVALDPDVYAAVEEQAGKRGERVETLVNRWLRDRLAGT